MRTDHPQHRLFTAVLSWWGQATETVLSGLREVAKHDPDKDVRQAARDALQRLQGKQSHPQSKDEDTT